MLLNPNLLDEQSNNQVALIHAHYFKVQPGSTVFGFVLDGMVFPSLNGRLHPVRVGEFFSGYYSEKNENDMIVLVPGQAFVVVVPNFKGHSVIGVPDLIGPGHVSYIDGCTDSLVIAPPRMGDPCLNILYFPPGIDQTFHTHPSFRAGVILKGEGVASLESGEVPLRAGNTFYLATNERHRFRTDKSPMTVLAYHPDSDWGPTDENHPMLNRTIIK